MFLSFIIKNGYQNDVGQHRGISRFDYWREMICHEYVQLACDPPPDKNITGFDGSIRTGIELGDVKFSEVIANPQIVKRTQEQISKAGENDFLISFQMEKHCIVRQYGREALLTPGSFVLYDSTAPYSLSFDEAFHQFVIKIPREVLARHLIEPEKYSAISMNANSGLGLVLKDFIFSLAGELGSSESEPSELLSENLVNLIALSFSSTVFQNNLAGSDCVKEALMRRIRAFIANNLLDTRLNNSRIAESQGISVRYLHKLFENQEESIHEMILNRRLAIAHDLLLGSGKTKPTIESVAYHVGFSGAPHFSRAFKARYGVCPSNIATLKRERS